MRPRIPTAQEGRTGRGAEKSRRRSDLERRGGRSKRRENYEVYLNSPSTQIRIPKICARPLQVKHITG
jgi:hypothetical protein